MSVREVFDASVAAQRGQKVLEWLRTFGPIHPASRVASYARLLTEHAQGRPFKLPELFVALYEIEELHRASQIDPAVLTSRNQKARIRRILKGGLVPETQVDDPGRSVSFELSTLAFFLKNGNDARPETPADVTILGPLPAFIECKRPTSGESVQESIEDSHRWIADHRPQLAGGLGLAAIDLSCAINREFVIADVATPEEGIRIAADVGARIVAPMAAKALGTLRPRRGGLDALLLRHRFVSCSREPRRITTHDEWVVLTSSSELQSRLQVLMGEVRWQPPSDTAPT